MLKLTGKQVVEINDLWHGNGGPMSLYELAEHLDMKVNDVYSVLSALHSKQSLGQKQISGMKVHSFDPDYGRAG